MLRCWRTGIVESLKLKVQKGQVVSPSVGAGLPAILSFPGLNRLQAGKLPQDGQSGCWLHAGPTF